MIIMGFRKIKNDIISRLDSEEEINYFDEKNRILETNKEYLSNFTFDSEPLVSIIIPNRDGLKYLKILFTDFDYKTNYSNYEIIVVDNASSDNSCNFIKSLGLNITLIENKENVSFSKANNDAVDICNGEYILFLNNDIEPTYGWLNEMMGTILYNENVGAVGAKLIYPHIQDPIKEKFSFSIQHYGGIFREHVCNQFDYAARHKYKRSKNIFDEKFLNNKKCIIATAAVLLMRKDTFLKLGKFDENYWYGFEDVDLNLKLFKQGLDVIVASSALLMHYESVSRKKETKQNYVVLNDKWGDYLFKELFFDKIDKNYFLTDKKLNFLFINPKFQKNFDQSRQIIKAVSYLKSQDYITNISDDSKLDIGRRVDILVSTSKDYDIENVNGRNNLIKVLIITDNEFNENKCKNYDIIISENGNLDLPNSYQINNLSNLGDDLLLILKKHYFK